MLVQVYGDNAMKKTTVCKWVTRFSEGRESVTDEERSRRPETSRYEEYIAKVRQIVRENRQLTVRKFLACKQITVLEHLLYSQDLAPNDFFCSRS
jgi:hypothetical protein